MISILKDECNFSLEELKENSNFNFNEYVLDNKFSNSLKIREDDKLLKLVFKKEQFY